METLSDGHAVVQEIFIQCPPEILFEFFIQPEKMVQWMGARAALDPRPGGAYDVQFRSADIVAGHYVEVIPPERIVMTWGWVGNAAFPSGSSRVEFRLGPQDGGTLLRLTHVGIPNTHRSTHAHGWRYYTGRLQQTVLGHQPGPDTFSVRVRDKGGI